MSHRFLKSDLRRQVLIFTYEDEDGYEQTHEFAATIGVCSSCRGTGVTTEHIDGHGITMDEWRHEWSHEEREDYLSGKYDRPCPECQGSRVELVLDEERADPQALATLREWQRDAAETDAIHAAERRMGA